MFSSEFCEISKNTFFEEYLWTTASKIVPKILSLLLNEFLESEIMQKSRSVQNITNIITVADE